MLTFIISLKSARTARSWERVSRLFARTIRSTCAQTSPEYRVIVACHEIPQGFQANSRLEFLQMQDSPPTGTDLRAMRCDKARKRLAGMNRAQELSPGHIMFLDADDCVSNRLAEFVAHHAGDNGWYIRSGYFYSERQKYLHFERLRFAQWCGSGHIVRPELLDFIDRSDDELQVYHTRLTRQLRQLHTPLRPLPFPGAVYAVAHGDNFNDYESILWPANPFKHLVRRVLFHRSLSSGIKQEFGLYPVTVHPDSLVENDV